MILLIALSTSLHAEPILIVGHKNPDSDSIFAAISLANLKTQQGLPALPIAQGKPNPQSQFILDYFKLKAPPVVLKVAGKKVVLVDHNNYMQSPDDIKDAELVGIVDHHNLGGMTTSTPLEVLIEPVGCTNTIIWQMYQRAEVTIPPSIAGAMLSAILSDTLAFKSPTTTELDKAAVKNLASIAKVKDIQKYAKHMFLAGEADLKTESIKNLIQRDFKNFEMNGSKIGVAQIEAYSFNLLTERKDQFLSEMRIMHEEQGYKTIVLMLTDISSEGSELLVIGDNQTAIGKAFNVRFMNDSSWVKGLVSRKKQVIPVLGDVFSGKAS